MMSGGPAAQAAAQSGNTATTYWQFGINHHVVRGPDNEEYVCDTLVSNTHDKEHRLREIHFLEKSRAVTLDPGDQGGTMPFQQGTEKWKVALIPDGSLRLWQMGHLNKEAKDILARSEIESTVWCVCDGVSQHCVAARPLLWCNATQKVRPFPMVFNIHESAKSTFKHLKDSMGKFLTVDQLCSNMQGRMAGQTLSARKTVFCNFTQEGEEVQLVGMALTAGDMTEHNRHLFVVKSPNGILYQLHEPEVRGRTLHYMNPELSVTSRELVRNVNLSQQCYYRQNVEIQLHYPLGCNPRVLSQMARSKVGVLMVGECFAGPTATPEDRASGVVYDAGNWQRAVMEAGSVRRSLDGSSFSKDRLWFLAWRRAPDTALWCLLLLQFKTNDGQGDVSVLRLNTIQLQKLLEAYQHRNDPNKEVAAWKNLDRKSMGRFVWTNEEVDLATHDHGKVIRIIEDWKSGIRNTLLEMQNGQWAVFTAESEELDDEKKLLPTRRVCVHPCDDETEEPDPNAQPFWINHASTTYVPPASEDFLLSAADFKEQVFALPSVVLGVEVTDVPEDETPLGAGKQYKVELIVMPLTVGTQKKITVTITGINDIQGGLVFTQIQRQLGSETDPVVFQFAEMARQFAANHQQDQVDKGRQKIESQSRVSALLAKVNSFLSPPKPSDAPKPPGKPGAPAASDEPAASGEPAAAGAEEDEVGSKKKRKDHIRLILCGNLVKGLEQSMDKDNKAKTCVKIDQNIQSPQALLPELISLAEDGVGLKLNIDHINMLSTRHGHVAASGTKTQGIYVTRARSRQSEPVIVFHCGGRPHLCACCTQLDKKGVGDDKFMVSIEATEDGNAPQLSQQLFAVAQVLEQQQRGF